MQLRNTIIGRHWGDFICLNHTNRGRNPPKSSTSRKGPSPPCLALKSLGFFFPEETFRCWVHSQHLQEVFQHQDQGWNRGGKRAHSYRTEVWMFQQKSDSCLGFFHRDKGPLHLLSKRSKNHYWALTKNTYNMDLIELKLLIRPLLH